jgi:hypothetical protein
MDNAKLDNDHPELVSALSSCQHSRPLHPHLLEGYFPTLEPRISFVSDEEAILIQEVHQDWSDRGGPPTGTGALSKAGGFTSLCYPEGIPQKLLNTAALSAIAFIEDGIVKSSPA